MVESSARRGAAKGGGWRIGSNRNRKIAQNFLENRKAAIKKRSKQKKGNVMQVEGSSFGGTVQVVQVVKKSQPKKGEGGPGFGGKKTKRGGQKRVQCHNCSGDHFLRDCKEWKETKEKLRSSSGKD